MTHKQNQKRYETAQQLRANLVGEAGQFDKLVIDALATWLGPNAA
ncbi:MAG: hypothetical protein CM15mP46_1420 [Alphaproteobacteria bacterium]|nr:MAG: hypothetical protein CM15mP46_1420 [Alphaproteobacteria bacterium]